MLNGKNVSIEDKIPSSNFKLLGRLVTFAKYERQTDKVLDYSNVKVKDPKDYHASGVVVRVGVNKSGDAYFTIINQMQREIIQDQVVTDEQGNVTAILGKYQPRTYRVVGVEDLKINGRHPVTDLDTVVRNDVSVGVELRDAA